MLFSVNWLRCGVRAGFGIVIEGDLKYRLPVCLFKLHVECNTWTVECNLRLLSGGDSVA